MKRAGIYQLKDRIFIHPWQLTETGLGMGTDPYVSLPFEVEPVDLGKAALDALKQSGRTIPHPTEWKAQGAARLKAAGVKTEKAFQTKASYVCLELRGGQILVDPSRNGGTKGDSKGFEAIAGFTIPVEADAPAVDLGNAICKGLRISHEQSNL